LTPKITSSSWLGSLLQLLLPSSKAAIIITDIATTASILSFSVQQEGEKNKQKQAPQTQWLLLLLLILLS
jgi:hypothetical protein